MLVDHARMTHCTFQVLSAVHQHINAVLSLVSTLDYQLPVPLTCKVYLKP